MPKHARSLNWRLHCTRGVVGVEVVGVVVEVGIVCLHAHAFDIVLIHYLVQQLNNFVLILK